MSNDKLYMVSMSALRYGYAPTLGAAKTLGAKIARLTERNDIKWNVFYVFVVISRQAGVGYYRDTGWAMAVPVRGSGARRERTVADIRRRYGVAPFKWFRRGRVV